MKNKKILFTLYFILSFAINVTAEDPDQQVQSCMNPIIGSPQGVPLCCGLYQGYNVQGCCNKFISQTAKDAYESNPTTVADPVAGCVADVAKLIETSGQSIDFKAIDKLALIWFTDMTNQLNTWLTSRLTWSLQELLASFQQTASNTAGSAVDQTQATLSDIQSGLADLFTSAINSGTSASASAPAGTSSNQSQATTSQNAVLDTSQSAVSGATGTTGAAVNSGTSASASAPAGTSSNQSQATTS